MRVFFLSTVFLAALFALSCEMIILGPVKRSSGRPLTLFFWRQNLTSSCMRLFPCLPDLQQFPGTVFVTAILVTSLENNE